MLPNPTENDSELNARIHFNRKRLGPYDLWRLMCLSVRAYNVLDAISTAYPPLVTIRDVSGLSEYALLRWKNCGKKTVDEIRTRLKELGLELGTEYLDKEMYWGA